MGYTQSIVKIIELVFHVHVGTFACCFFRVVEGIAIFHGVDHIPMVFGC